MIANNLNWMATGTARVAVQVDVTGDSHVMRLGEPVHLDVVCRVRPAGCLQISSGWSQVSMRAAEAREGLLTA